MQFRIFRRWAARAVLSCLPLASGVVYAGAGVLITEVTPLSPSITYSTLATTSPARPALETFVAYRVRIANDSGNTINNVRFVGASAVTDAQEKAKLATVDGAVSCQFGADEVSLNCNIGQLKGGEAAPEFIVFFRAPVKDTVSPTPDGQLGACATTDCVTFAGTTFYAEGTGGLNNSQPINSTVNWSAQVALGTFNPTLVKSAVPRGGARLFTGDAGLTYGADRFSTTIVVPAGTLPTTAEIAETSQTTCSVLTECFVSTITAPGTFSPYLTIVLRADQAVIPKGTKIQSVTVQYEGEDVGLCASPTTPRTDGKPCIADRKVYPSNSRAGLLFPIELENDFEWTLINLGNGSYKIF